MNYSGISMWLHWTWVVKHAHHKEVMRNDCQLQTVGS